ncbi:Eaa protein [Escherichia coli]|nr:DUF551 domain-containing protein [Escherichia coli]STL23087.1 Eaa protein [Escherichia coli]
MALAVDSISFDAVRVALNLVANMQRLEMTARFFIQRLEQSGISEQRRQTVSKIDYQVLREAAEKAGEDKWQAKKINGDFFVIRHGSYTRQHGYTSYQPIAEIDCKPVRDFVAKANPATVLELLDELEAAKKRIAELEDEPVSQTYKLNELSGNPPVTPDGWISCSERMPDDGQHVIILCDGAFVLYAQYRDSEFFDIVRNGDEFFETQSRNVTDWMPLPEQPQEVNGG